MGNSFSKYDTFIAISILIHLFFSVYFPLWLSWNSQKSEIQNLRLWHEIMNNSSTIAIKCFYCLYSFINLKITLTCHYYEPFLLGFLREAVKTLTHRMMRNIVKSCKMSTTCKLVSYHGTQILLVFICFLNSWNFYYNHYFLYFSRAVEKYTFYTQEKVCCLQSPVP